MYRIIGADQREYGPVTADELRTWIAQGRANGQSPIKPDGATEWKPLGTFPEFAAALGASRSGPIPPTLAADYSTLPADIRERDYDLDIGHCIGRAWNLIKENFWTVVGGCTIFVLIKLGLALFSYIPLLGILVGVGSLIINGALMGGLYYFLLKCARHENANIGQLFAGFGPRFAHLLLVNMIQVLILIGASLPGGVIGFIGAWPLFQDAEPTATQLIMMVIGAILVLVPLIYLSISWVFSFALVIDKQLDFWPAMETSRRVVGKHWFVIFALAIVVGLMGFVGFIGCCVGVFVTITAGWTTLVFAYEDIFGQRPG
jgi:hypothetical protein